MENYGIKELYSVALKATFNMKIGEKEYEPNETILHFENLQLAALNENKSTITATGGYNNREFIYWDNTRNVNFICERGIVSPVGLAILSNSNLRQEQSIEVPFYEVIEPINGAIELSHLPTKGFIYSKDGEKLYSNINQQKYNATDTVVADYYYTYTNGGRIIELGDRLCNGYLRLEGKMRLKDDFDGHDKTAIITIPKIRIASNLTMRLGRKTGALVNSFSFTGIPVGQRGAEKVLDYTLLNDDIDSDF